MGNVLSRKVKSPKAKQDSFCIVIQPALLLLEITLRGFSSGVRSWGTLQSGAMTLQKAESFAKQSF